jgi:hypothetical protein
MASCHVERPLDDRAWRCFSRWQKRMPGGFRIAALLRPPDEENGEDADLWLRRAREAATRSPLGHHTHWGGEKYARPLGGDPAERVLREGALFHDLGLTPTLFCGGGWYMDDPVAEAIADLGYADCTATTFAPSYLACSEPQLRLSRPCWLELPSGRRLLEVPTTHSLGMLARTVLRRGHLEHPLVHVYFHDTDLLDQRRAAALRTSLVVLARRRTPTDFDQLAMNARSQELPVCHS